MVIEVLVTHNLFKELNSTTDLIYPYKNNNLILNSSLELSKTKSDTINNYF